MLRGRLAMLVRIGRARLALLVRVGRALLALRIRVGRSLLALLMRVGMAYCKGGVAPKLRRFERTVRVGGRENLRVSSVPKGCARHSSRVCDSWSGGCGQAGSDTDALSHGECIE